MAKYRVGGLTKTYKTFEEAKDFAGAYFERHGVFLEIVEVKKKPTAKQLKAINDARINRAVVGFRIPMLSMPKMYAALEAAIADGKTDEELKAVVAAFPDVEVA